MIVSAKWQNTANTEASVVLGSGEEWFSVTAVHRFWQDLQDWIRFGNTPAPFSPVVRPPKSDAPLNAEEIATLMVSKSLITRAEFDAIKTSR